MVFTQVELEFYTPGQGLLEITREIGAWVLGQGVNTGLLTVFCRHTSASLIIQENADPDVKSDLDLFFKRLVKEDVTLYHHTAEGADDMPAHIRTSLTDVSLGIPVKAGRLALGRWQGVFLFEHRVKPHRRCLVLHLAGE